jgi:hypothetical protein
MRPGCMQSKLVAGAQAQEAAATSSLNWQGEVFQVLREKNASPSTPCR